MLSRNDDGWMAWHYAAERGHIDVLEMLWARARVKTFDLKLRVTESVGKSLWNLAKLNNDPIVLEEFWQKSEEDLKTNNYKFNRELVMSNRPNNGNAFHLAAERGLAEILKKI